MLLAQSREKHAGKDAVHCKGGCSAVQGRMQCSARADAVQCKGGCSALRLRWPQKVPKSSVHFLDISTETILDLRTYIIYMYNYRRRVHPRKNFFALPQYLILKKCEEEREKPQTCGESVKGRQLPPVRRDRATAVHPIAYS